MIAKYKERFPAVLEYDKDYSHLVPWGAENTPAYKWNWVDFLTDKEKKELKNIIHPPPQPPKMFDMSQGIEIKFSSDEMWELRKQSSCSPPSDVYNEFVATDDNEVEKKKPEKEEKVKS